MSNARISLKRIEFTFHGEDFSLPTPQLFLLATAVGVIGATYGVGGGSIIAPILVTVFRVPVYAISGPVFLTTFVTSVGGVVAYTVLEWAGVSAGLTVQPDWLLGIMLGVGGAAGIYLGSRVQRFVPARIIKLVIFAAVLIVVVKYVMEFFGG